MTTCLTCSTTVTPQTKFCPQCGQMQSTSNTVRKSSKSQSVLRFIGTFRRITGLIVGLILLILIYIGDRSTDITTSAAPPQEPVYPGQVDPNDSPNPDQDMEESTPSIAHNRVNIQEVIVGTWVTGSRDYVEIVYTFGEDGRLSKRGYLSAPEDPIEYTVEGTYEFIDDNRVRIQGTGISTVPRTSAATVHEVMDVQFYGTHMTFQGIEPGDKAEVYKRR